MGQTDVGSFVISAYTPTTQRFFLTKHSEDVAAATPRKAESVTGSAILDTFEASLMAIREGLDSYKRRPEVGLFLEAVDEGVSFELATALGAFVREGDAGIKITRRIIDSSGVRTREVAFDAVEAGVLERVATALAQNPEPTWAVIVGEVTDLSRKLREGVRDRVIRLDVKQGGKASTVRIRLTAEQYDQAMAAHRAEQWLRVSSTIEREGRLSWIYHPDHIEAEEPPIRGAVEDAPLDFES